MSDEIIPPSSNSVQAPPTPFDATGFVGVVVDGVLQEMIGATDRTFSWFMSSPVFVPATGVENLLSVGQTTYDASSGVFSVNTTVPASTVTAPQLDIIPANPTDDGPNSHYLAAIISSELVDIIGVHDRMYWALTNNPVFVNLSGIQNSVKIGQATYDANANTLTNPDGTVLNVPAVNTSNQ